jgi:hypothetical protein
MRLIVKAKVRRVTGNTKHAIGRLAEEMPVAASPLPPPQWVGISRDGGGFFLLHFNEAGKRFNDTWHESFQRAKAQALFEFDILESDWQEADDEVIF